MKYSLTVFTNRQAFISVTDGEGGEGWRKAEPEEVIEGKAVRDYPPGVHELKTLPPDPNP